MRVAARPYVASLGVDGRRVEPVPSAESAKSQRKGIDGPIALWHTHFCRCESGPRQRRLPPDVATRCGLRAMRGPGCVAGRIARQRARPHAPLLVSEQGLIARSVLSSKPCDVTAVMSVWV